MKKESVKKYMARGGKIKKLSAVPITETETMNIKRENMGPLGSSGHRNYPKKNRR